MSIWEKPEVDPKKERFIRNLSQETEAARKRRAELPAEELENWLEIKKDMRFYDEVRENAMKDWEKEMQVISPPAEEDVRGYYTVNNGVIALVDKNGRYFTAPLMPESRQMLEQAGFTNKDVLFVPFSNGEVPYEKELRSKWGKSVAERNEAWKKENEAK